MIDITDIKPRVRFSDGTEVVPAYTRRPKSIPGKYALITKTLWTKAQQIIMDNDITCNVVVTNNFEYVFTFYNEDDFLWAKMVLG